MISNKYNDALTTICLNCDFYRGSQGRGCFRASLSSNLFCWFYSKFSVLSLPCNIKTLIQKLQGRKTCVAKLHTADVFLIINNTSQQEAPNTCKDYGTIPNPCTHLVPTFVGHGRTKRAPEKQHAVSTLKEDSRQLCVEGGRWEKTHFSRQLFSLPTSIQRYDKSRYLHAIWPWPSLLR